MKLNNLRVSLLFFTFAYVMSVLMFSFVSYKFFISNFVNIEENLNKKNVASFLRNMDKSLVNLKNITVDYAIWDDTYRFIRDNDKEYVYENFREGSNTLEDLEISSILFTTLDNKSVFSTYNIEVNYLVDKKEFESFLIEKIRDTKEFVGILEYKKLPFYVVKSPVMKTDRSGTSNGYMMTVKFIKMQQLLEDNNHIFKTLEIDNKKISNDTAFSIPLSQIKNVNISYDFIDNETINYIGFYNFKNKFLFTIITNNEDMITSEGKRIIAVFNLIGSLILLVIFIVIYQNQRLIINQNKILNKKIIKRTKQLNRAYKTLKTKNRALFKMANIDTLTGISNRANFFTKSMLLLKESNKSYSNFAVLIIDIDYFKKINDEYSHSAGDKVLVKFTEIVNGIIDEDMVFGRIGGEEFCITIFNNDENSVYDLSEEIRKKCSEVVLEVNGKTINFTVSIGVAFKKSSIETIDEILHNADLLLYKAKEGGRNRIIRGS